MQQLRRRTTSLTVAVIATLSLTALTGQVAEAAEVATATSNATDGLRYIGTSAHNDVRVTVAGSTFTVDDAVPIQAGAGCAPVAGDPTKVTCVAFRDAVGKLKRFSVALDDGADTVVNQTTSATAVGAPMTASGGFGDDVLIGADKVDDNLHGGDGADLLRGLGGSDELIGALGDDTLEGGSGLDELDGRSGADRLDGGEGDDRLDGGPGADLIDGGQPTPNAFVHDLVLYTSRSTPITVDLTRTDAVQGAQGEGDTIRRVQDAFTGSGSDTLVGDAANNRLTANAGNDTLIGNEGRDVLDGDDGADVLSASREIGFFDIAPDGEPDFLGCGGDDDIAFLVFDDEDLANDCEFAFDA